MIRTFLAAVARCSVALECAKCLIFHEARLLLRAKPDMNPATYSHLKPKIQRCSPHSLPETSKPA